MNSVAQHCRCAGSARRSGHIFRCGNFAREPFACRRLSPMRQRYLRRAAGSRNNSHTKMKTLSKIRDVRAIGERVGTAGQPSEDQFRSVRDAGFEAVINLALPTSDKAMAHEGSIVTGLGMSYLDDGAKSVGRNAQLAPDQQIGQNGEGCTRSATENVLFHFFIPLMTAQKQSAPAHRCRSALHQILASHLFCRF